MSISSISSNQNVMSHRMPPPGGPGGAGGPLKAAEGVLGMSAADIAKQLASGKSLTDIAESKGVSNEDLKQALVDGLPEGVAGTQGVDAMIEAIMTKAGPPPGMGSGGFGGGPGGGAGFGTAPTGIMGGSMTSSQTQMLDALSALLDTDSDDLVSKLSSGTSLAQLLADKAIKPEQLASVIESGLLFDAKA